MQAESNENNNITTKAFDLQAPDVDLVVTETDVPPIIKIGQLFTVAWTVTNQGQEDATNTFWYDRIYLSSDSILDPNDLVLATVSVNGPVGAGASYSLSQSLTIPTYYNVDPNQNWFVLIGPDNYNYQSETNENNNVIAVATDIQTPDVDLVVANIDAPAIAKMGQNITVSWTVTNQGQETSSTPWYDRVYLSSDGILDGVNDIYLANVYVPQPLAGGASYTLSQNLRVPTYIDPNKNWVVIVKTDAGNEQSETNENNNVTTVVTDVQTPDVDLAVTNISAPAVAQLGQNLAVSWTVTNQGQESSSSSWYDRIYLSPDGVLDNVGEIALANVLVTGPVASGASYTLDRNLTVPNNIDPNKDWFVLIKTDNYNSQIETNDNNNVATKAIDIQTGQVDLTVTNITAPAAATIGRDFLVSWTVINQGQQGTSASYWYDTVYLSADGVIDGTNDFAIASAYFLGPLAPGASYTLSQNAAISTFYDIDPNLNWSLVVETDDYNAQLETNENNNTTAVAIDVQTSQVDLVVAERNIPAIAKLGQNFTVSWTVTNQGSEASFNSWSDTVYLNVG